LVPLQIGTAPVDQRVEDRPGIGVKASGGYREIHLLEEGLDAAPQGIVDSPNGRQRLDRIRMYGGQAQSSEVGRGRVLKPERCLTFGF
jgi:hypothetical protein